MKTFKDITVKSDERVLSEFKGKKVRRTNGDIHEILHIAAEEDDLIAYLTEDKWDYVEELELI